MADDAPASDYTDDELLAIVKSERARSIGFDNDSELIEQRMLALDYLKGEMPDVPALANRSRAVSTDVADAVETVLPDLMDILTGGEDIATFKPVSPQDEPQAEQETDYVLHTIFEENDGFLTLYTMVKDALQVKTGVVTWWAEDVEAPEPEEFRNQPEAAVMLAQQDGELVDLRAAEDPPENALEPLYDFEMASQGPSRRIKIGPVSPDDFTVAADTIRLSQATYCAMRTRPRAQDLLAEGIDRDTVEQLPAFESLNTAERESRDTVGEHQKWDAAGAIGDLRQVEVVAHYIRLLDKGKTVVWRVLTGHSESVLVKREIVNRIPFAAITPYVVTHRFYGESVADKLIEIQRIRTALTRMGLDGGYFALNQRVEVAMHDANDFTLPDLLRNEPGMPIRSKTGNAVKPIQAGGTGFNAFEAMEVFAKAGEERTGIMRYGQGLKPDSLHDTMGGAMVQLNSAQKRVRLIARVFVETGIRDFFLGVHALLRENGSPGLARLRNKWVQIDPTNWAERNEMVVQIGVGSAGRDHDLMALREIIGLQEKAVEAQPMLGAQLVSPMNIYNAATKLARTNGLKAPELFFSDPSQQPAQPPGPQKPDPKAQADQAKAQNDQQRIQLQAQGDQQRLQLDAAKAAAEHQRETDRQQMEQARFQFEQKAHADKIALEHRKLDLAQLGVHVEAQGDAQERDLKARETAERLSMDRDRNDQTHVAAMTGIHERHETALQTTGMRVNADLAIQASEARDTELEQDAPDADDEPTGSGE